MFRNFHDAIEGVFGNFSKLNGVVFGKMQPYKPNKFGNSPRPFIPECIWCICCLLMLVTGL